MFRGVKLPTASFTRSMNERQGFSQKQHRKKVFSYLDKVKNWFYRRRRVFTAFLLNHLPIPEQPVVATVSCRSSVV